MPLDTVIFHRGDTQTILKFLQRGHYLYGFTAAAIRIEVLSNPPSVVATSYANFPLAMGSGLSSLVVCGSVSIWIHQHPLKLVAH